MIIGERSTKAGIIARIMPLHLTKWSLFLCIYLDFTNSLGSAIILPHFLHLATSNGSYMGIITLTLGSGEGCSRKILLTETYSNDHN
jgi:hypothetical protein